MVYFEKKSNSCFGRFGKKIFYYIARVFEIKTTFDAFIISELMLSFTLYTVQYVLSPFRPWEYRLGWGVWGKSTCLGKEMGDDDCGRNREESAFAEKKSNKRLDGCGCVQPYVFVRYV